MKELVNPWWNGKSITRIDQDQSAQRYYIRNRSLESLDKLFVLSQYCGNQVDLDPSTMPSLLSHSAPTTTQPRQSKETGIGPSSTPAHPACHRWAGWGRLLAEQRWYAGIDSWRIQDRCSSARRSLGKRRLYLCQEYYNRELAMPLTEM
jgi:hypothetical protein